ncbi:Glycerate 2-kinase [Paraconexibacter sp. AEG42_29]|uniref:Glycerate 2-kinase n=1 Tax=Paraconexibacter sp. AEG42_29 TaxID=2997339 RepID=A0AAU7B2I7_9ACTN
MARFLVAPDSFKGTFTAAQVAAAIGRGLESSGAPPPDLCPVADGGEGTLAVLLTALGGTTGGATVAGPLGDPVVAGFALIEDGGTAIVEVAGASGLGLVPDSRVGPQAAWDASTRGTGELIVAAARAGAEVILVAAGGSATTDGGAGAVAAIEAAGGLGGAALVVLCDVRTPFEEAARVFAPQKGADAACVERLSARLDEVAARLPRDPRGVPLAGAAGGLAGGLWAAFGAHLEGGAAFVLDAVGFDERLQAADALVVGEGRLDGQTGQGKIVGELAARAAAAGMPCHAIVGQDGTDDAGRGALGLAGVSEATSLAAIEAAAVALARAVRGA